MRIKISDRPADVALFSTQVTVNAVGGRDEVTRTNQRSRAAPDLDHTNFGRYGSAADLLL
jgi:hypothetical protein